MKSTDKDENMSNQEFIDFLTSALEKTHAYLSKEMDRSMAYVGMILELRSENQRLRDQLEGKKS